MKQGAVPRGPARRWVERFDGRRTAFIGLLLLGAIGTSLWRYLLAPEEPPATLSGPPRSDYTLIDFELIALDESGAEAFSLRAPQLNRDPHLRTLDVDEPRFEMPIADGTRWRASAGHAGINAAGDIVDLWQSVVIDAPPDAAGGAIRVKSERLRWFVEDERLTTDSDLEVTGPGSILRGHGLDAELGIRRFRLLADVEGRHDPVRR